MIITVVQEGKEMDIIRNLFREYEKELDADLCFQSFEQELKDPLKKIRRTGRFDNARL